MNFNYINFHKVYFIKCNICYLWLYFRSYEKVKYMVLNIPLNVLSVHQEFINWLLAIISKE